MPANEREAVRMRHARRIAGALATLFTATLLREVISLAVVDVARNAREPMTVVLAAASAGFWLMFWLLRTVDTRPSHLAPPSARR